MELLLRIDKALKASGKSRAELARELGISTQAITSLKHRPNATMKHENLEKAAQALGCDLHWLKTGKGSARLRGDAAQPAPRVFLAHSGEPTVDRDADDLEMEASTVYANYKLHLDEQQRKRLLDLLWTMLSEKQQAKA